MQHYCIATAVATGNATFQADELAAGGADPGPGPRNVTNAEDSATVAEAKLPDGGMQRTVAMRTELREAEPHKFSMDLDVEAYPADAVRPYAPRQPFTTIPFRRGWDAVLAA